MRPESRARPRYPPGHAFVMQLQADVSIETGRIDGRIEHVVSGRAAHFSSWEKVLAFIAHILNEMDHDKARDHQP